MTPLKAFGAMLSLLLLGKVSGNDRLIVAAVVCACRLAGVRSLEALTLVSVIFLVFAPPFCGIVPNHWPQIDAVLEANYGESPVGLAEVRYLGWLGKLILGFLLFRLVRPWGRGARLIGLHAGLLATFFLVEPLLQSGPVQGAVVMSSLIGLCFYFHYLCYMTLENPNLGPTRFGLQFTTFFWEASTSPRPLMEVACEPSSRENELLNRCLRQAWVGIVLIVLGSLGNGLLFGTKFYGWELPFSAAVPNLSVLGPTSSLVLVYPRWELLFSMLWTGIHRITNYFALFTFLECCHLLLQQDVPNRFTFPWKARSFGDFYNYIMPYYVVVVNRIYLYPYFSVLRRGRWNRKLAYDLALFGAVFSGGFFTHMMRDVHLVALIGARDFLWRSFLTDGSYCTLLFLAIRFAKLPAWLDRRAPQWFRFAVFLCVYSVIIFFRIGGLYISFPERLRFCAVLFLGWEP